MPAWSKAKGNGVGNGLDGGGQRWPKATAAAAVAAAAAAQRRRAAARRAAARALRFLRISVTETVFTVIDVPLPIHDPSSLF